MAGPGFGDVQSGMMLAGGVGAALFQRERTGKGSVVDVSLLSAGMWAMQPTMVASSLTGVDVLPIPSHDSIGNPLVNTYRTADDRYLTFGMLESDRYWPGFCEVTGKSEWVTDPRFAGPAARADNRQVLTALLDDLFGRFTLAEWRETLGRQEGPWTVLQLPSEVLRDPQAEANRYVQDVDYGEGRTLRLISAPVQFDGSPGDLTPAPEHGAHTEEVLLEMGIDWDEIARMKGAGIVN
jgi:crotonobetainyl-CoA:carnitine CoA-transferase CaiB-like acyl-CoA transferase